MKDLSELNQARIPTQNGEFEMYLFDDFEDQKEHLAFVKVHTDKNHSPEPPLVRVHSECITGEVSGSLRCDCKWQLEEAMRLLSKAPQGAIIYLRQEGRGIGLGAKLKAYQLQDQGLDTAEANEKLGFEADGREFEVAADILKRLNFNQIHLLTNNPKKQEGLEAAGIIVQKCVPIIAAKTSFNKSYLETKAHKMGHRF